jgi:hypothetical protein
MGLPELPVYGFRVVWRCSLRQVLPTDGGIRNYESERN